MKRFITKTPNGYRVYGSWSCIMDIDAYGQVTYSNVKQGCLEWMSMFKIYINSQYFVNK